MGVASAVAGAACLGVATRLLLRDCRAADGPPGRGGGGRARLPVGAISTLVALVWLAMVLASRVHFVDVPRWDIWDTVRELERYHAGTLSWSDWWRPHNEHRPVTARLVVLPTAFFFHWNHWIEFGAVMVTAGLLLLVIARFVGGTCRAAQAVSPAVLVPIAVVTFSLAQWENWLRGYHVHILMGAVGPSAALLWLSTGRRSWRRLLMALAATIVGVLSFGAAMLAWPIGTAVLVVRGGDGWRARLLAWCTAAVVTLALYLPGLPRRPGLSEVAVSSVFEAVRVGAGVLVGLAMPILYVPQVFTTSVSLAQVVVVGIAGVALLTAIVLVSARWRADVHADHVWVFPAALVAFGAGTLTLAALGRVSGGLYAMTAPRYVVYSGCFWTGLLLLAAMRSAGRQRGVSVASALLIAFIGLAAVTAWPLAWPMMARDAAVVREARDALREGDVGRAAPVLYPDPVALERMRQVLETHRLSVYRPGAR